MTVKDRLLAHLKSGKVLNRRTAYEQLGVMSVAPRIWDLRQEGYPIRTIMRVAHNRFGEKCRVADYILEHQQ